MSTTTPLRPLELPPFKLYPLLFTVFDQLPTFNTTNPNPIVKSAISVNSDEFPSSLSRLGQFVASSVAGGDISNKSEVVRCLEASRDRIWVGGSSGSVKIYSGKETDQVGVASLQDTLSLSPCSPIKRTAAGETEVIELIGHVMVTSNRKSVDRIAFLERIGRIAILSEGLLTFHSLPSLAPLPLSAFPSVKGVVAFSLDEDEVAGGGARDAVHICVVKRRTVYILRVTKNEVTIVGDLPLPGGAFLAVLRRKYICIANSEEYSIVDLDRSILLPVIPISQGANNDPLPDRPESPATPIPPGGFDPRQRPVLACAGTNEFLVASHTGSTTLGVFVTETGEACRGTLAWASNLRSLYVDSSYVTALLHNNTIEIHSLHTLEIVQVIQISTSAASLFSFQPRSLARLASGFDIGSSTGASKTDLISLPLLPTSASLTQFKDPRPDSVRPSGPNSTPTLSKTFLLGRNGIYALAPLTLVAQVDALIEKDRFQDALELATQIENSDPPNTNNPELNYVFLRAAHIALNLTLFEEAFSLFLRSKCDPRLVIRLFPDLRETLFLLLQTDEEILVCRGVESDVLEARTVDDFVLASLTHNYSPHVEPNVESASSTSQLRLILLTSAREGMRNYLSRWRARQRSEGVGKEETSSLTVELSKVGMVVDTILVQLLAEERRSEDLLSILTGPNDCVIVHVESSLLEAGLYQMLADIYLKRGDIARTLSVWTKLFDGIYVDPEFVNGLALIYDVLADSRDELIVEQYGLWIIGRDVSMGIKLFTDSKQRLIFDTRDLFTKISQVDEQAGDLFLESTVFQKRDSDARLHADLVKRYINRLTSLLLDVATKEHLLDQEIAYRTLAAQNLPNTPTFLAYLVSHYNETSSQAAFDRIRLKTILFLGTSSNYDLAGTKKELEGMEMRGLKGLTLERAIVYGRLQLDRQSLSLLLNSLSDFTSSQNYCRQSGDPLLASDLSSAATTLNLPVPSTTVPLRNDGSEGRPRRKYLARLLVEMCLSRRIESKGNLSTEGESEEAQAEDDRIRSKRDQVARILEAQSIHLDVLEVLPLIPSDWPLEIISPFLSRSLRVSLHASQESGLLKSLALSENAVISERLGDKQISMGGTLAEVGDLVSEDIEEVIEVKLEEKEKSIARATRKSRIGRRG